MTHMNSPWIVKGIVDQVKAQWRLAHEGMYSMLSIDAVCNAANSVNPFAWYKRLIAVPHRLKGVA